MRVRILNFAFVAFGTVLFVGSLRSLLHGEYAYFDSLRQVRISNFFPLLAGIWFFLYGLNALIRANLGKRSDNLSNRLGCVFILLAAFAPVIVTGYLWHSTAGLYFFLLGVILLLFVSAIFGIFRKKRIVTPEQFADELERHLLGTEGKWDWDDTTTIALADQRLERIRWDLSRFYSLSDDKDKEELRALIGAIRSGNFPEVVPPKFLTYGER